MTDYTLLREQLISLTEGVSDPVANLSNAAALLYDTLDRINWAGFYFLRGESLILGPFQGKPACVKIPLGKGVCGTAAQTDETLVVPDVHHFPGHIACDSASNSEIVIPLRRDGKVIGVLDIDSPVFDRFTDNDRQGLERFAAETERLICFSARPSF